MLLTSGYAFNYTHGQPSKTVQTVTSSAAAWSGKTWTVETTVSYDNSIAASKNCRGYPTAVTVKRTNDSPENESRVQNRSYNSNCQLLTEVAGGATDPTSERLKTSYGYVSGGLLNSVTNDAENGSLADRRTVFGYDTRGYRVTSQTNEIDNQDNVVVTQTWHYQLGLQASRTDPRSQQTVWFYDGFGRLETETVPGSANSSVTYIDCGTCFPNHAAYKVDTVLSGGALSRSFFDSYGRVVGRENLLVDGDYSRQQLTYNARGQLVSEQTPYIGSPTGSTSYVYNDVLGRVTQVTAPAPDGGNAVTHYTYTPLTVAVQDAETHTTTQRTDPLGQLREVAPPLVGVTQYTYRPFGELATVTDPGGSAAIKTWTYDGLGNPETYVDVNSGTWTYDYNVFGELVSQTDDQSPANVITASYDQLGRITQRVEPTLGLLQGNTTTWTYETTSTANGFGLVKNISGPTELSATGFNEYYVYEEPYGRPSRIDTRIENVTHVTDYDYDNSTGELTELTYPASVWGVRHKIIYDYTYGYLDRVQWHDSVNTHDIYDVVDADPLGRPNDIGWGPFGASSHTTAYNYHPASLQLEGIQTSGTGSNDVQDYSYTWDKVGNLETRQDHNQSGLTESFGYDDLNRLIQVDLSTETNPTLVMTYTGNGNILTKTGVTAGAGVYQYGQNGAGPHAVTGISQAATDYNHYSSFHYDANGNMDCRGATTSACSGGDPVSWYAFNKPQQITRGSDSASFVYGPDRSRIKQKRVAGTKTLNIDYAGNHFEREKVDNKIRWRLNVYAYGELIYWIQEYRIQNTCSVTTGSDSYFVLKDHLGSVDQTVHDQGSGSGEQHSYDAFGLRRDVAGWADDADYSQLTTDEQLDRGYTEHEHLDNVRAIHMNGRVQDPIIGRMLSVDPIVGGATPQTHNGYSYVGNNPVSATDPTGLFTTNPHRQGFVDMAFDLISFADLDRAVQAAEEYGVAWRQSLKEGCTPVCTDVDLSKFDWSYIDAIAGAARGIISSSMAVGKYHRDQTYSQNKSRELAAADAEAQRWRNSARDGARNNDATGEIVGYAESAGGALVPIYETSALDFAGGILTNPFHPVGRAFQNGGRIVANNFGYTPATINIRQMGVFSDSFADAAEMWVAGSTMAAGGIVTFGGRAMLTAYGAYSNVSLVNDFRTNGLTPKNATSALFAIHGGIVGRGANSGVVDAISLGLSELNNAIWRNSK